MATENEGMRLHEWGGRLRHERWPIEDPGPGEVQVVVEACGVGLTVVSYMSGANWNDPSLLPRVPGHEIVGRVVATGPEVSSPAVGERVLGYFYLSCFRCSQCLAGRETRCERLAGRYGVHRDGGYARLTNLPAGNTIPFPSDLDAVAATVIPDAVATPVHVCRTRLALEPGERVVVIGAGGGVGVHMIQVAAASGAEVLGLDRTEAKLDLVERMGVRAADSTRFEDVRLEEWGGAADAVIDLVGSSESLSWALGHLAQGGRLCVLTTHPGVSVPVSPRDLVASEAAVVGSHYASRHEVAEAAGMVVGGEVVPVVGRHVPGPEVEELHDLIRRGELLGRGAVVWNGSGAA